MKGAAQQLCALVIASHAEWMHFAGMCTDHTPSLGSSLSCLSYLCWDVRKVRLPTLTFVVHTRTSTHETHTRHRRSCSWMMEGS